jgi:YesN/AraC family two-component response regulator
MTKNLLLVIFLYSTVLWAQKSASPPEDIFVKTISETAVRDVPRALKIADSLTKNAKAPDIRGRGYLLTANIYMMQSKYEESIRFAEKAKEILDETENYELQARARGVLSENYQYTGLDHKSKKYLDEGLKIADKIKDVKKKAFVKSRFCSNITDWEAGNGRFDNAIKSEFQALKYLSEIPKDSLHIGHHYRTLASLYFETKKYDLSEEYYQKAIKILPNPSNDFALANNGLGEVYLEQKRYDEAEKIFLKTLEFAKTAHHTGLKKLASECLADLYEAKKEYKKASFYRKEQTETNSKLQGNAVRFLIKDYDKIEKEKDQYESWNSIKNILIIIASLLILGLVVIFIINRRKHKAEYQKFKSIIDHYKEKEEYVLETTVDTSHIEETENEEEAVAREIETENKKSDIAINKETEAKILTQLDQFEKDKMFNNSNVSLSYLAIEFNTNIRYISYVVKKHKNADFKSYINKLRINYIIHKLNTSEKYRRYKVGALAEECGFSSHSKFTTIFKSITGISPSVFVSFIEQEATKKKVSN